MSIFRTFAWIAIFSYSANTFACDMHGKTGIVEENDQYIAVDDKSAGGISETQFNTIISKVTSHYKDIISNMGSILLVDRKWKNGKVNAFAKQYIREDDGASIYNITMFGGLARHSSITPDGFALVVCHEMGHHLGGAPIKTRSKWASNEGQSDYWGIMKCLRKVWDKDNNIRIMKNIVVPSTLAQKCNIAQNNMKEIALCRRTAMAGYSLASMFTEMRKLPNKVKFNTPVLKEVSVIFDGHPAPQCRLDTYFQASLCDVSFFNEVSRTDVDRGTCVRDAGKEMGSRPKCWYRL